MLTESILKRGRHAYGSFAVLPESKQWLWILAIASYFSADLLPSLFAKGFDFTGFYQAAHRVVTGQGAAVYQELFTLDPVSHADLFGYTAPVALLYAPLGLLSIRAAWSLFQIVSHVCLWGAWWLAICEARDRGIVDPEFRVTVGVALFFPLYYSLWIGQCEAIILFLLMGAIRLHRRKNGWLPGTLLAVAICLKFFLAFILVYFFLTKRLRLFLSCLGGLIVLEAASLLAVPAQVQIHFWRFAPLWTARIQPFYDNQAVSGFFCRLLTINVYTHGIANLPGLAQILGLATIGGILMVYLYNLRKFPSDDFGRGFFYTLVTALLISPITDTHHFALLLFPFLLEDYSPEHRPIWLSFYSFFALFIPSITYRYRDFDRYTFWATGFHTMLFSLSFFVLIALWFYLPGDRAPSRA